MTPSLVLEPRSSVGSEIDRTGQCTDLKGDQEMQKSVGLVYPVAVMAFNFVNAPVKA
jgi:hypothetical protein